MESHLVAIVIPAFNEEASIRKVVESVKDIGVVIVVNDNSMDRTEDFALDAGSVVVSLGVNRGYEGAIEEGFRKALDLNVQFVVTMDADGQHTGDSVELLVAELKSQRYDLVLGVREKSARFGEYLFGQYFKMRFSVKDPLCGLKGYGINLFREYGSFDTQKLVGSELLLFALKNKAKFTQVPIRVLGRDGESRYGSICKANIKILKALFRVFLMDIKK